ncbi:MAG: ATP-binding protein [Verrucomicrobiota bacterium]
MNTYLTISSLVNTFSGLLLLSLLFSSRGIDRVKSRFILLTISVIGWSFSYFLWRISDSATLALLYCQFLTVFSIFSPITFLDFCLELVGLRRRMPVFLGYLLCLVVALMVAAGYVVEGVESKYGHVFWPVAGELFYVYIICFVLTVALSCAVLFYGTKKHIGRRASDCTFVFCTGLIGFLGAATNFPLWVDIPMQPFGNILVAVYLVTIGHGLYSQRISGISTDVYKAFVGIFLNASATLFYLILVALYRTLIEEPMASDEFWFHGVFAFSASALVFWGVPKLKVLSEHIVEGVFRREINTALAELQALPTELSELGEIDAIAQVTADTIKSSLGVSGVAVYHNDEFSSEFRCIYSSGSFSRDVNGYKILTTNPVVERLSLRPECLVLNHVADDYREAFYKALVLLKNDLGLTVVVPIFASHQIYGLIFLGGTDQPRPWSEEEIATLFNIAAQIGLNMRARDFERRSSEIDKLVALGTMAAGLSHEIRNPLVSIQTFASLLKKGKSVEKLPDDFREVLVRDVKRIESIVDGVASYSKNQKGRKAPIDIREVVESSLRIYEQAADAQGIEWKLTLPREGEAIVMANFDQMVQVFNNLIENAIQALAVRAKGEIEIDLGLRNLSKQGSRRWVEISIADNGDGVPDSIIDRIFDPFMTSKDTGSRDEKQGMGLGLAISKRIIENHDGAISVSNFPGGGAKFVVSLRLFDSK